MDRSALIEVKDLSVSFGSKNDFRSAVSHISFAVKRGSTLAIVGESGSGKTVSSLSLMKLLSVSKTRFDSGSFHLSSSFFPDDEERELKPSDQELARLRGKGIAMIFQEPMTSLNPVMKCGEQVVEMIRAHEDVTAEQAVQRALQLFKEVKLPRPEEMLNQYPHQLSGGQRQRVMIAMAIACKPLVLIADEPTTALDVTVQKEVLQLIRELQKTHEMGLIFITHDLGVVAEIADEVLVMRKGEMIEFGPTQKILSHPSHPYTQGLMACRPEAGKKVSRLLTIEDFELSKGADVSRDETYVQPVFDQVMLRVEHLKKHYEKRKGMFNAKVEVVKAVDDVSFEIMEGETLGLVGESGCGKTTLSRMLLGLIPATSGSILMGDIQLVGKSQKQLRALRKDVQIIFQDPYSSLNPKMTVGQTLMEPMMFYGLFESAAKRRIRAVELLNKVGLGEEHLQRYPHEFSGGQRQRIVISRALAVEPKFVICDESVSALDVSVQAQVLNLLNDLKRDFGLTYLFISHDLGVVYHMSDRIMVMRGGRVEEMGPAHEVFYHPQSAYTRKLIDAIPGNWNKAGI